MDGIRMVPCYDLCWWAMPVLERDYWRFGERDPGGLVSAAVNLDWIIDMSLEAM